MTLQRLAILVAIDASRQEPIDPAIAERDQLPPEEEAEASPQEQEGTPSTPTGESTSTPRPE